MSEVHAPAAPVAGLTEILPAAGYGLVRGIEPRDDSTPATVITLGPGMTMAEIERVAIQAALRDTGGNRRKAAEILGIGERTLYRKLREYEGDFGADEDGSVDEA
jgi:DNA-binding NtrC family response regulator